MESPIATELTQKVLEMRRRRFELGAPQLDSVNRRRYSIVGSGYKLRAFIADPDMDQTSDAAQPNPPTRAAVGFHPEAD